jgi:hypothetical protein
MFLNLAAVGKLRLQEEQFLKSHANMQQQVTAVDFCYLKKMRE